MKKLMTLFIMTLLIFGFNGSLLAQDDGIIGSELVLEEVPLQGTVGVTFHDISGNPITSIKRGNPVQVSAYHDPVGPPLKATCILILPVNSPAYKETALFSRSYTGGPVTGEGFTFYIPGWIQIEGTAIAVVIVKDAGVGYAVLQVTP